MRVFRNLFAISILLCLLPFTALSQEKNPPLVNLSARQVFEKFQKSVYTIKTDKSVGTGFLTPFGMITCFHVIEGAKTIEAVQPGKPPLSLTHIAGYNKEADIACLVVPYQLRTEQSVNVSLSGQKDVAVGDPVFVIGSPQGLENTLTEGILSARRTIADKILLQLSAAISKGSSGSPVFTKQGKVVGMVTSYLAEGQQLNFALSMDSILGLLPEGIPIGLVLSGGHTNPSKENNEKPVSLVNDLVLNKMFDLSKTNKRNPVYGIREIYVVIEDTKTVPTVSFSKQDMKNWVVAELARSCPKLKVVEANGERGKNPVPDVWELFREADRLATSLYVNVGLMYNEVSGYTFYTYQLSCERPVWSVGGNLKATVWYKGGFGFFGKAKDGEEILRAAVKGLVEKFADEWVIANKE